MKADKKVLKGIVMISQIGISMLVPIVLCIYLGRRLDDRFLTEYFTIILSILGIAAAYRNVYRLTKSFYIKDKAREDALLSYMKDTSSEKNAKGKIEKDTVEKEFRKWKKEKDRR